MPEDEPAVARRSAHRARDVVVACVLTASAVLVGIVAVSRASGWAMAVAAIEWSVALGFMAHAVARPHTERAVKFAVSFVAVASLLAAAVFAVSQDGAIPVVMIGAMGCVAIGEMWLAPAPRSSE